jgi:hypothetical protein
MYCFERLRGAGPSTSHGICPTCFEWAARALDGLPESAMTAVETLTAAGLDSESVARAEILALALEVGAQIPVLADVSGHLCVPSEYAAQVIGREPGGAMPFWAAEWAEAMTAPGAYIRMQVEVSQVYVDGYEIGSVSEVIRRVLRGEE